MKFKQNFFRYFVTVVLIILIWIGLKLLSGQSPEAESLERVTIAVGVAVDPYDEHPGKLKATIQVANPKKLKEGSTTQQSEVFNYTGVGWTIGQALANASAKLPVSVQFSHIQVLLLNEKIAREGDIFSILEYFVRDHLVTQQMPVVIVGEKNAGDIFKLFTPINDYTPLQIRTILSYSKNYMNEQEIYPSDILYKRLAPGRDIVLPILYVRGNEKKGEKMENVQSHNSNTRIDVASRAIFSGPFMVGTIPGEMSEYLNMMNNKNTEHILTFPTSKQEKVTFFFRDIAPNVKILKWGENPVVKISVKIKGVVLSITSEEKNLNNTNYAPLQKQLEKYLEKKIIKDFMYAKEMKSDIFGLEQILYRSNYKKWKKFRKNQVEPLNHITLTLDIQANITSIGDMKETINWKEVSRDESQD